MPFSTTVRRAALRGYLKALLAGDRLSGGRFDMIPRCCRWDGKNHSELKASGEQFLRYFIDECGVKPNTRVLDVGCGIGRIAVALTHYLSDAGSYEGLDIIPDAIRWCSAKIASRYPNFRFQFADIANKRYNPKGRISATEYAFPFEDDSFDFVFLGSVFTHMLPPELEQYLSEIARVLNVGGTTLITYFLLTPEAVRRIERGESTLRFVHHGDSFRSVSNIVPEIAVAYDESYIIGLYERYQLGLNVPIRNGTWSYSVSDFEYQDFVFAKKETTLSKEESSRF